MNRQSLEKISDTEDQVKQQAQLFLLKVEIYLTGAFAVPLVGLRVSSVTTNHSQTAPNVNVSCRAKRLTINTNE